ncbi:MAG: TfoX/Sxy family protein [Planctomycetaceae bacterium]
MAFDNQLAERIRPAMVTAGAVEKKMFGGLGFLIQGNMCVGVWKESLIARVGPDAYESALQDPNAREFDITGRAMRGWVMVDCSSLDETEFANWLERSLDFVLTLPAKS